MQCQTQTKKPEVITHTVEVSSRYPLCFINKRLLQLVPLFLYVAEIYRGEKDHVY